MMVDFISREAAIEYACENCEPSSCDRNCELLQILKQLPAADVLPVVHGEWQRIDYKPCGHDYKCSACDFKNDEPNNFCPNCGADMREVDDEKA